MPRQSKTEEKVTVKKTTVKKSVEKKTATGLKADVLDVKGKVIQKIDLPKEVFGAKVNKELMVQAIRVYLANKRRGTVSTKTRGEVHASTKKIYRQKGTGRARHGAVSAPIFVGGGLVFGPKPRDYSLKLPKKMRKAALFSSLTVKRESGEIKVLSGLEKLEPKTKNIADVLKKLVLDDKKRKVLLVTPLKSEVKSVYQAGKNLSGVEIISANLLNTFDVLNNQVIILMKDSIETMKNTFLKENK